MVTEKLYIIQLKGAQDPEDKAYRQPVRASNVEVSGETLSRSPSDGTLSAFFDMSAVSSWAEADESQLKWGKDKPVRHKGVSMSAYTIPENRQLNAEERKMIEWLIAHESLKRSISVTTRSLHVVSHCSCGCPTVDLAVVNAQASTTGPSLILADFLGITPEGQQVGVVLHARQGKISELEVYPMDTIVGSSLPKIGTLSPFDRPTDCA